jgi:hypothetical protein
MALQHLRSGTADKRPTPGAMSDGQLAINTNATSPGLFFKDSAGALVKVGPVHIGTTAPNATPATGGEAGNSVGEQWLDTSGGGYSLKIWDGSAWRSEAGEFVNASGDTMTGALVMDNQQQVRFRETTANGTNYIALQAPASVASDKTITLPDVTGTVVTTGDTGSVTSTMIADSTIVDGDISASAEIAVSKLADGTARQLLQTDAAGTGVEWTSNVDVPGTLDVTSTATFDSIASHPLGTAGAPTITFTGDTNTGIYSPGADQVAISTNGTGRLFVASNGNVGVGVASASQALEVSGNIAFSANTGSSRTLGPALSSDTTLVLRAGSTTGEGANIELGRDEIVYVDAAQHVFRSTNGGSERMRLDSSGRLGLGTSSPGAILHTSQTSAGSSVIGAAIRNNSATASTGVSLDLSPTDAAPGVRSAQVEATNNGSNQINLNFKVSNGDVPATRMTLDYLGRLGIGATTPDVNLVVEAATGDATIRVHAAENNGSSEARLKLETSSDFAESQIVFADSSGDGGGIYYNHGDNAMRFMVNSAGSERARLDSSGRLLVGTSSSSADAIAVFLGRSSAPGGTGGEIKLAHPTTNVPSSGTLGRIQFGNTGDARGAEIWAFADSTWASNDYPANLVFSTTADGASSPTERMRITSDGNLLIGQQTNPANSRVAIQVQTGTGNGVNAQITSNTGTSFPWANYNASGTYVGGISCTSTATSFPTSSDYRLKQNVHPLVNASALVAQLKPSTFEFKEEAGTRVQGFIAHELQEVVPLAVIGEKDAVDANGNPIYQGVDAAKLVPLLTAALQEALAEIESLKARLTAAGI